ncbi:DUF2897 family protein [Shewanella acanthi]|uniref:DUF2897 family protein n=1 Tax=Shewanella acanthi TaxID=2864212 RepID=UPI001C659B6F|nr:DUF2897 family protein [Shewanella acanthi]QYJ80345.1 DUF2897 family protein [Shewanella acanthi]
MSNFEAWIIIILVVGVVVSNLAVLKYSSKFKMPQFGQDKGHDTSLKGKTSGTEEPEAEQATSAPDKTPPTDSDSDAEIKK